MNELKLMASIYPFYGMGRQQNAGSNKCAAIKNKNVGISY